MRFLAPISEGRRGLSAFPWGVRWLLNHKLYLTLLLLPMLAGLGLITVSWHWLGPLRDQWVTSLVPAATDGFWAHSLHYFTWAMVSLGLLILTFLSAILVMNILAAPLYEVVSIAVERELTRAPVEEPSLLATIKLMGEEFKKALFILGISTLLLFIPVFNVIAIFITALMIGWDYCDYPLARRGWTFRQRLSHIMRNPWAVGGFGIWLMIPFFQIFLLPLAVVGGTKLTLDLVQSGDTPVK